ncbi:MAG: PAS domain S-box protein, partial [Candidatus Thermoplasmatota archaeon]|nr:PAS domain S-box protein [Candidatus Thermoplasmatota archaeon]
SVNRFSLKPVYTYVSPSFKKILGYEPSELIGKNGFDFVHPDDKKKLFSLLKWYISMKAKKFAGLPQNELVEQISYRFKNKAGTWHDMESTVNSLGNELVFISKDVTERNRNEKKYRTLFENLNEAAYLMSLPDGTYEYLNPAAKEVFGYSAEEFLKNPKLIQKIIHPDFKEYFIHALESLLKGIIPKTYEYKIIGPDNEERWVLQSNQGIFNDKGEIIAIEGICRNITKTKEAEEELKKRYESEKVISRISSRFINPLDTETCINKSLQDLGLLCNASRSYLFMIHDDMTLMTNTHEWCADGVEPMIHKLQQLPTSDFPWWMSRLQKGKSIKISDLSDIPLEGKNERGILQQQNIKSLLVLPIIIKDGLIGFIGFDNIAESYFWNEHDIRILHVFSEIFSSYVEKKNAEEQKQLSEESYRTIYNSSNDSIFLHDITSGKIIDVNQTTLDKFGYSKKELMELTPGDLSLNESPYSQKEALGWMRKAFEEGPQEFEWLSKTKNNKFIWHKNSIKKVRIAGKDRILVVARDITNQKKVENSLKESESKYQSLVETLNEGIWKIDEHANTTFVNKHMADMLGYTKEEMIGISLFSFMDEQGKKIAKQKLNNRLQGYAERHAFEFIKKDGEKLYVEIIATPLLDESGSYQGALAAVIDVTELKKAHEKLIVMNKGLEKLVDERTRKIQHLLKQKDEFINQLSHDLKNPLGPFIYLLPILKNNMTNEKNVEIVEVLQRNAKYMQNLVKRTIELARLNSSKTQFTFESIDLSDLLNEVIWLNNSLFDREHMLVNNSISSGISVNVDKLHIQEVFTNLFNNAVKYSKEPGTITIDANRNDNDVTVSVKDAGIGISPDQLPYLFDEYFKADSSRHDFDSTGLGLPICKRIIERHGGRIWAESEGHEKGSTFYFTLPLTDV